LLYANYLLRQTENLTQSIFCGEFQNSRELKRKKIGTEIKRLSENGLKKLGNCVE